MELYEVINTWDNSREFIGTFKECCDFVDNMANFTTQNFDIREIPDDEED